MSDDASDKRLFTPAASEEPASRAVSPLPETSVTMPGIPAPVPRSGRRGRVQRWLLVSLVGMLVLAAGIGLLVSLLQRAGNPAPASTFQEASCSFKPAAGVVEGRDLRCGYLTMSEDHNRPQGPTIRLAVAIIKASYAFPAPDPVIDLEGGPGSPVLAHLGPVLTPNNIPNVWPGDRDLILLDQHGIGYSLPSLFCTEFTTMPHATFLQVMRACHDRLVREDINLSAYTTIQNAEDVHDLVRTLGYRQVNLSDLSYGTRLALTVMRLFPADIRSVVLDSTYPPQVNGFTGFPAAAQRAFDTLFQGCAADPYCNQHYPHLQAVFARLVSDLNQHPAPVQVTDPQTGKLVSHCTAARVRSVPVVERPAGSRGTEAASRQRHSHPDPQRRVRSHDTTCMSGVGEPLFE